MVRIEDITEKQADKKEKDQFLIWHLKQYFGKDIRAGIFGDLISLWNSKQEKIGSMERNEPILILENDAYLKIAKRFGKMYEATFHREFTIKTDYSGSSQ